MFIVFCHKFLNIRTTLTLINSPELKVSIPRYKFSLSYLSLLQLANTLILVLNLGRTA